jgi:hypothetical protein
MSCKVGVVIPTIGQRPEYLPLALRSIRKAGPAYILLVGNESFNFDDFVEQGLIDQYCDEPESGLAEKINFGLRELPRDIEYITWLGDDDLLTEGSLDLVLNRIMQPDLPVLVFGACEYIDPRGNKLFINKSGNWAIPLLRIGPQLIPQPGALFTRSGFEKVGGLNSSYDLAFDFDLFYNLSKIGNVAYMPNVLSKFRWHPGSLSVSKRKQSVAEASQVRKSYLPKGIRIFSELWEFPIRILTYSAGMLLTRKLNRKINHLI